MKFQYKINGVESDERTFSDKDRAVQAARKTAVGSSHDKSIIHIEIFDEDGNIVHRDMILKENLKDMDLSDLSQQGLVDLNKKREYAVEKTKRKEEPLLPVGGYLIINGELHILVSVTPERAQAQPVRRKQVEIVDKITGKKTNFTIKRRSVSIAPYGVGLSKEEVEIELIKVKELEKSGKHTGNDITVEHDNRSDTGESSKGTGHSKNRGGDSTND
jgi:hypothetical protein